MRTTNSTSKLISLLNDAGKEVALIGPSIYDETAQLESANHFGANTGIQACIERLQQMADERSLGFVDFNAPMLAANAWIQANDPSGTIVGGDRIHPGVEGHYLMAGVFLKAQDCPSIVTEVVLDAQQARWSRIRNGQKHPVRRHFAVLHLLPASAPLTSHYGLHPGRNGG